MKNEQKAMNCLMLAAIVLALYIGLAWTAFEWRNPLCNEAAFYRHFPSVMSFQRLEQYQEGVPR